MPEDKYVNQAYISCLESSANTLTFKKLETGTSIHEKIGWVIHRIDYFMQAGSGDFSDGDVLRFGISVMDTLTAVSMAQSAVIDFASVARRDWGTAASGFIQKSPFTKTFADLPGGGLLVPPNPLYLFAQGVGLTNAQTVQVRMFYTVKSLKTEDFWELVEMRRMIGA